MYSRVTLVLGFALIVCSAACGGSKSNGTGSASCTPNTMSVPRSVGDPCPQNTTVCPAAMGYVAVSTCSATGTWSTMCACVLASTLGSTGTSGNGAGASGCGNGMIDPATEKCDGSALGGQTCATLMPGTMGTLKCASNCNFDTTMCTRPIGVGGTGH